MGLPTFFKLGQSQPGIDADFIDALVVNNLGFGGTSGVQSLAAGKSLAVALWNPATSGYNVLIYGLQMSADTAGTQAVVASLNADPTLGSTSQIQAKHRQSSGGASSAITLEYSNTATTAPSAATTTDAHILGTVPYQYGDGLADIFLRPGTGVEIYLSSPSAGAFKGAVNLDWLEFSNA